MFRRKLAAIFGLTILFVVYLIKYGREDAATGGGNIKISAYWRNTYPKKVRVIPVSIKDGEIKTHGTNIKAIKSENERRLENIKQMCKDPVVGDLPSALRSPNIYEAKEFNLAYCYFQKSGSTTMKNIIRMLSLKNIKSYQTYRTEALKIKEYGWLPNVSHSHMDNLVIFRNPYERLYSGYRDRVYLWVEVTGKKGKCPGNTGFEHFLRDILKTLKKDPRKVDSHFSPLSFRCRPCEQNLKYVIKFENYAEELEYVWHDIRVNGSLLEIVQEIAHGTVWTGEKVNGRAANKMADFNKSKRKCVSDLQMAKKLWSELQRQGFLNGNITFPTTSVKTNISANYLGILAKQAIESHPITPEKAMQQRREAFQKAYSRIPKDIITKIQKTYYADFKLFGYDLEPNF